MSKNPDMRKSNKSEKSRFWGPGSSPVKIKPHESPYKEVAARWAMATTDLDWLLHIDVDEALALPSRAVRASHLFGAIAEDVDIPTSLGSDKMVPSG